MSVTSMNIVYNTETAEPNIVIQLTYPVAVLTIEQLVGTEESKNIIGTEVLHSLRNISRKDLPEEYRYDPSAILRKSAAIFNTDK